MAFEELESLESEVTISLGGLDRKTNQPHPKTAEGYYLGSKKIDDRKKKSGFSYIHILKTPKGNLGVWGKTDLDRKLTTVSPGTMVRLTHAGMRETPNGEMYVYKVEQDKSRSIGVSFAPPAAASSSPSNESSYNDESLFDSEDVTEFDSAPPVKATAPKAAPKAPDAARQAKVQELLGGARAKLGS